MKKRILSAIIIFLPLIVNAYDVKIDGVSYSENLYVSHDCSNEYINENDSISNNGASDTSVRHNNRRGLSPALPYEIRYTGTNKTLYDCNPFEATGYEVYKATLSQIENDLCKRLNITREELYDIYGKEPIGWENEYSQFFKKDGQWVECAEDETIGTLTIIPDFSGETQNQSGSFIYEFEGSDIELLYSYWTWKTGEKTFEIERAFKYESDSIGYLDLYIVFTTKVTFKPKGTEPETKKCATPSISYADKKLTYTCTTEGVEFVSEIKDADITKYYDSEVSLSATYEISVYATKEGYENSDVATATLVWTEATFTETTPPAPTSAKAVTQTIPLLISANNGTITVNSPEGEGQTVNVYSIDGKSLGSGTIRNGKAIIQTSLTDGDPFIVKAGNRSVKLMMK